MNPDVAELIRAPRLSGGVFVDARFSDPWSVSVSVTAADCARFLVQPGLIIGYHVVVAGRMHVLFEEGGAVDVEAGQILLLPRNDPHVMTSAPELPPVDANGLIERVADGWLPRIEHGGGGRPTHVVCGFLGAEDAADPLISTLPRVLVASISDTVARDWIAASAMFAAGGGGDRRAPDGHVAARLGEAMFLEAVRACASSLGEGGSGPFAAARDGRIARVLAMIHAAPRISWSTAALAREAGMSRSAFVARFAEVMGRPPIQYLKELRLREACDRLLDTSQTLAAVAEAVGYGSEEALSRAFKRRYGEPPARWRHRAEADRAR